MIHGHKAAAYFSTGDGQGHKIEGEQRQCVHCQFLWDYRPGSGDERGWCLNCGGYLCGRMQCLSEQRKYIEYMRVHYNKTRSCVPFEEWNSRIRDKVAPKFPLDPELTFTEEGIIVPRSVIE
jgi:hypothetical protein